MGKRKSLSKKTRMDVFKRDFFKCQYCGNHPPAIILEADHITPVSKGGGNHIDNLVTSCFDCNRGKGATELSVVPETVAAKAELLREKEAQVKAFKALQKATKARITREVNQIEDVFTNIFEGYGFSDKFRISVKTFLSKLPFYEVEDAMEKACSKIPDSNNALKYFCGICWNKIKDDADQ